MRISATGYGAGDRDFKETPNVLRVLVGEAAAHTHAVTVVECEIDDMNPQLFGPLMDRLYRAGALEVFYVPVQMKKNRPGHAGHRAGGAATGGKPSPTCCFARRRQSACAMRSGSASA